MLSWPKQICILMLITASLNLWSGSFRSAGSIKHVKSAILPHSGSVSLVSGWQSYRFSDVVGSIQDNHFNAGVFYSPSSAIKIGFLSTLFQHNHLSKDGSDAPSHMDIRATLATSGLCDSSLYWGVCFSSRLPLDMHANLPLHHYSAKRIRFGVTGLSTLAFHFMHMDWRMDVNSGLLDHNDQGVNVAQMETDSVLVDKSTKEIVYGVSLQNSFKHWGCYVELSGRQFLKRPPASVFARENSIYLTPGLVIKPVEWLSLNISLDILMRGQGDLTDYRVGWARRFENAPNLPDWRFRSGLTVVLDAGRSGSRADDLRDALGMPAGPQSVPADSLGGREQIMRELEKGSVSEQEFIRLYKKLLLEERQENEAVIKELRKRLQENQETDQDK